MPEITANITFSESEWVLLNEALEMYKKNVIDNETTSDAQKANQLNEVKEINNRITEDVFKNFELSRQRMLKIMEQVKKDAIRKSKR